MDIYDIAARFDSVALAQENTSLKEQLQATKESNASLYSTNSHLETKLKCANRQVADLKLQNKYNLNRTMVENKSLRNQLGKSKAELEAVKLNCSKFKAFADALEDIGRKIQALRQIQIDRLKGQKDTASDAQACKMAEMP